MFDVYFAEGPAVNDEGWWHAAGTIVLGERRDGLEISLQWWGRAAYERHCLVPPDASRVGRTA